MRYLRALGEFDGSAWGVLIGLTIIAAVFLYAFLSPTYDGRLDPDNPYSLENYRYHETPELWNRMVEKTCPQAIGHKGDLLNDKINAWLDCQRSQR